MSRIRPDRFDHLVEVVLSFVLAYLSWKFVETPFRKGRLRLARGRLFVAAGSVMAACTLFAVVSMASSGWPHRFAPDAVRIGSCLSEAEFRQDEKTQRMGTCFVDATSTQKLMDFDVCLHQDPIKRNYLLLGDSHAAAIWHALQTALPDVNVMQANVTSCPATIGPHPPGACRSVMDYVFQQYLPTHPVQELLLESDWQVADLGPLEETLQWAKAHQVPVIVIAVCPSTMRLWRVCWRIPLPGTGLPRQPSTALNANLCWIES